MMNNTIEHVIEHIHEDKKEWARTLSPIDIANILNSFANLKKYKTHPNQLTTNQSSNMHQPSVNQSSNIPAIAGLQGEQAFEKMTRRNLPGDFTIANTAKTSKSGDFIISWVSHKTNKTYIMLVDVKNYKTSVPSKEVVKFHRDVELRDVDCGMLISLQSKIVGFNTIESKYTLVGSKKIPLVFMQSQMPSAITEIIKTTFSIIEISELHNNKVTLIDDFISSINDLKDNVNVISQCRDTLIQSKHDIEKSLNAVLMNMMTCEYNLVANIKKIQATMANYNVIEEKLSPDDLLLYDTFAETEIDDAKNLIKYMNKTFNIPQNMESMIYQIINILMPNNYTVNISKKNISFVVSDKLGMVVMKFMKTLSHIIFESATKSMITLIEKMKKNKLCRITSAGHVIKINESTIENILQLCKLINP